MSTLTTRIMDVSDKLAYAAAGVVLVAGMGYSVSIWNQPDHGLAPINQEDFRQACNVDLATTESNRTIQESPLAQQFTFSVNQTALQDCMADKFYHANADHEGFPLQASLFSFMTALMLARGGLKLGENRKSRPDLAPSPQ